jgi:hypothetical protein
MNRVGHGIDQIPPAEELAAYAEADSRLPSLIMAAVRRERTLNALYAFLGMFIAVGVLATLLWFAYIAAFQRGNAVLTGIFVGGTCLNVVLKFLAARLQQ